MVWIIRSNIARKDRLPQTRYDKTPIRIARYRRTHEELGPSLLAATQRESYRVVTRPRGPDHVDLLYFPDRRTVENVLKDLPSEVDGWLVQLTPSWIPRKSVIFKFKQVFKNNEGEAAKDVKRARGWRHICCLIQWPLIEIRLEFVSGLD